MTRVNVVVTCTKRKTRPPAEGLRLQTVESGTPEERAAGWVSHLRSATGEAVPALDLYAGDHWAVVRELPGAGARGGHEVRLWICSAGYGLIPASAEIHPYSATFSAGHPDAVHSPGPLGRSETHRRWWDAISAWEGPVPGAPRTLADLAAQEPGSPLLVVASPSYLDPLTKDLRAATGALRQPDSLLVLSGGAGPLQGLERQQVHFDARLQRRLGGAMMSLNVRLVREVLAGGVPIRSDEVAAFVDALARDLPEFRYPERRRQSDEEVTAYIREELGRDGQVRWSPLHRKLREQLGLACEQKRFRSLYEAVRAELPTGR